MRANLAGTVTSLTLPMGIERTEVAEAGPGEIVGIAGISGNGQRELVEVLAGQRPATAGGIQANQAEAATATDADFTAAARIYVR